MKDSHKDYCENYDGPLSGLASDIGGMTHAARAELFGALGDYVAGQCAADAARGRVKYAAVLGEIAEHLQHIKKLEDAAWEICKSKTRVISR